MGPESATTMVRRSCTIEEASGRLTASRNPRSQRRCDRIAARDRINQHRNPPKSGRAVTRQGRWCGAARRRSGAREAQAGVPHSDCPTTLLQEDGRVKLAIAHVNERDVHRNLSRSTTTAHIQNRSGRKRAAGRAAGLSTTRALPFERAGACCTRCNASHLLQRPVTCNVRSRARCTMWQVCACLRRCNTCA